MVVIRLLSLDDLLISVGEIDPLAASLDYKKIIIKNIRYKDHNKLPTNNHLISINYTRDC